VAANKTLDRENGVFRVDNSLSFGSLAYQTFSVFSEGNH
jgi:hypothetical protein